MSYYTYFKSEKKELSNDDEINKALRLVQEARLNLILSLVDAYYVKEIRDAVNQPILYFRMLKYSCDRYYELFEDRNWNDSIENGEVAINHFNKSKYELEESISNIDEYIYNNFKNLMILTRIKYDKDDTEYKDQTINDWLKSKYINDIENELDSIEGYYADKYWNQHILECYDTMRKEDDN